METIGTMHSMPSTLCGNGNPSAHWLQMTYNAKCGAELNPLAQHSPKKAPIYYGLGAQKP